MKFSFLPFLLTAIYYINMIDPYRMVFVNVSLSSFLILAFLFYKFIYPKKTPPYIVILFFISLLPLVSILRIGSYESGDLSLHAMRTISFYKILFEEHIRPVWTPEFNAGYGDPHFFVSYFLPYFLASIIHKIGFSLIFSIKALLAITYIFSGIFMYIWVKHEINEKAGLIAAVFYLFAPYHLVDMHFRVTVAESMSFAFLPISLYFASKLIKTSSIKYLILLSLSLSLLILTHQVISLCFVPILISYSLVIYYLKKQKTLKELIFLLFSVILGLGLSAFYWIPIIFESRFTQGSISSYIVIYPTPKNLLFSPWRGGFLFQGPYGEISYLIGYTQLFVLILSFISLFLIKNKATKYTVFYFLTMSLLLIYLILPYSKLIWENVPLLNFFQFSYRLLVFVSLSTAFLAGIMVAKFKNKYFFIILCSVTIFSTILNWGNRKAIPEINDYWLQQELIRKPDVGSYLEPSSPIWTNEKYKFLRKNDGKHVEVLSGDAQISQIQRTSTHHEYIVKANSDTKIKENTLYYPGWNVYINNKKEQTSYNNSGVMTLNFGPGFYKVDLKFEDTFDRKISKTVTLLSAFVLFILIFARHHTNVSGAKRKRYVS